MKTSGFVESTVHQLSIDLYKKLYMIRKSEEFIIELYPQDEMKTPMHMSKGQEAIAVGVCHALQLKDQIWTSYRSHAAFLAKTEDTDQFFAEMYGKVTGTARGKAGSLHLADPSRGYMAASAIVASSIPPAVGMAFANKVKKNGNISAVFFGDGALDEGNFWESLNVASAMKLPVLFVCEDNGLSVHTLPEIRQGYHSIVEVVNTFQCTVFKEDTTDVESIYNLTNQALETIRKTGQPAFLHLKYYRYLEHVGISEDFNAGYRSKDEYEQWLKKDSVALQRARLINQGLSPENVQRLETEIDDQIRASIKRAQEAPLPEPEDLYRGVFYEKD